MERMKDSSPLDPDASSNRMYLVELGRTVSSADSLDDAMERTRGLWQALHDRMTAEETLWVVSPNEYRDGRAWPVAMATADVAREEAPLTLKNTITVHRWEDHEADMESAYVEILLFVRDGREYQFHKDEIRVDHVYEGHEWGGTREEGTSSYHDTAVQRYNENGKDPGNVWLEEVRTGTTDRSVDETRPLSLPEAVRRCVLAGSSEDETIYLVDVRDDDLVDAITEENRSVETLAASALRREVVE